MTDEDILRRLKAVRHSSRDDRARKRSLSISDIARETGIAREHLQKVAGGQLSIGPKTRTALREYFSCDTNDGEKSPVRSTAQSAFPTGSGPVFTFKFPV